MSRSLTEINVHFVWATKKREPVLTPHWERRIYRSIENECHYLHCTILALGGMPDHVHLLMVVPAHRAPSAVMQQIKGVSARFANAEMRISEFLQWQEGYHASSVSHSHVVLVKQYVLGQKQHHADGTLLQDWEQPINDQL